MDTQNTLAREMSSSRRSARSRTPRSAYVAGQTTGEYHDGVPRGLLTRPGAGGRPSRKRPIEKKKGGQGKSSHKKKRQTTVDDDEEDGEDDEEDSEEGSEAWGVPNVEWVAGQDRGHGFTALASGDYHEGSYQRVSSAFPPLATVSMCVPSLPTPLITASTLFPLY